LSTSLSISSSFSFTQSPSWIQHSDHKLSLYSMSIIRYSVRYLKYLDVNSIARVG
jgi:hypothetical protein